MISAIKLSDFYPSAFVFENSAAAVYYAVNHNLKEGYNENILFLNIGQGGMKLSLVNVSVDKENKYPVVKNI